ncbi:hypothetical protein RCL1_002326 [Eukaryota sp. TZLM3-RCL]
MLQLLLLVLIRFSLTKWNVPSVFMILWYALQSVVFPKVTPSRNSILETVCSVMCSVCFVQSLLLLPFSMIISVSLLVWQPSIASTQFHKNFRTSFLAASLIVSFVLSHRIHSIGVLVLGLCFLCTTHLVSLYYSKCTTCQIDFFGRFQFSSEEVTTPSRPLHSVLLLLLYFQLIDRSQWAYGPLQYKAITYFLFLATTVISVIRTVKQRFNSGTMFYRYYSIGGLVFLSGSLSAVLHSEVSFITELLPLVFVLPVVYVDSIKFSESYAVVSKSDPTDLGLKTVEFPSLRILLNRFLVFVCFVLLAAIVTSFTYVHADWNKARMSITETSDFFDGRKWPLMSPVDIKDWITLDNRFESFASVIQSCSLEYPSYLPSIEPPSLPVSLLEDKKLSFVIPILNKHELSNLFVLIYSILNTKTQVPITVIHFDLFSFPNDYVSTLQCLGIRVRKMRSVQCPYGRVCSDNLSLLSLFSLVKFDTIVVLNANSVVLKPLDDLFLIQSDVAASRASPDFISAASGLMVMRPSRETFNTLSHDLKKHSSLFLPSVYSSPLSYGHDDSFGAFLEYYMKFSLLRLPLNYDGAGSALWCGSGRRFLSTLHMNNVVYNTAVKPWHLDRIDRIPGSFFDFWFGIELQMIEDLRFARCMLSD